MLSFSLPPAPQLGERKSCPWTLCCSSASWLLCKAYMPVVCVWRHGRHCNCTHVQSNVFEYEGVAVLSNLLFSIFAMLTLLRASVGQVARIATMCSIRDLWSLVLAWLPAIVHRYFWIIDPCVWNDTQCAGDWHLYPCLCMGYDDIVRHWECCLSAFWEFCLPAFLFCCAWMREIFLSWHFCICLCFCSSQLDGC